MNNTLWNHLIVAVISLLIGSGSFSVTAATPVEQPAPKNLIIMVGDGMGMPYLSAYRYFHDARPYTFEQDVKRTIFDHYFVGTASTYPSDETWVTDSAAGATALATGIKSYNGAISVNAEQESLKTMMEYAKDKGFLTGTVVTTRLTHATPAGFFAHVEKRRMENEIAQQYATLREDGQPIFDIMIGSGSNKFRFTTEEGEPIDYLEQMTEQGIRVAESFEALQTQQRLPLIAFMHEGDFPYVIDDKSRLKSLTQEALRLIEADGRPFVIMIEASMIDWCGHSNDIACAMHEMRELDETLTFLAQYVEDRGDTSLVLTADHSTGGLTLGADGQYQWKAAQVNRIQRSLRVMAKELAELPQIDWDEYIGIHLPFPLSLEQQEDVLRVAALTDKDRWKEIQKTLISIVRYHTGTGFTTGGHTGEDVPVIAIGPWAHLFRGNQDHTDIAKQYIDWIKAAPAVQ